MVALAMLAVCGVRPAAADIRSDQAAAILEWPSVLFAEDDEGPTGTFEVADTIIQISNTSTDPVFVFCFYENANAHCLGGAADGTVCTEALDCCLPGTGCGICAPGWNETDFRFQLTPRQPIGWLASQGLSGFQDSFDASFPPKQFGVFPLGGVTRFGINNSSNAGSRIPPVPESPFNGSLRCIAVDEDNIPVDRNVLKGESTLTVLEDGDGDDFDEITVAKHNAIGVQAIEGAVNDDNILVLGGPEPEYNGCPNFNILNHFFDFAENPAIEDSEGIFTFVTFVPCTQDYLRQIPGATVVQFLVYNEFEQRLSTSFTVVCKEVTQLSLIDTTQPQRSIFSAGVSGTLTGQTRMNPLNGGLFVVATEVHDGHGIAEFNVHYQGDREAPDLITLP
jgi:hypothetical protein